SASDSVTQPPMVTAEQVELSQLRVEQQIRKAVDNALTGSGLLRDRVELEVDRAFDHFATILNILLTLLTAVPIAIAVGVWLLRRSVISELVTQVREQIEKEITEEVKRQRDISVQQIESLKQLSLEQFNQMVADAQASLDGMNRNIDAAKKEVEGLKSQATSQLQAMVADAQAVKDDTIQELTKLLPDSPQDPLPPDVQPKIGRLTAILESLKSVIPQLSFSAGDYVKQGNAFFFEGRYDEAILSYEKALQLNPEFYEAWFGEASVLLISQQYEEAIEAYNEAITLKPDSYEAHFGQASAYRKLQQWEAAIIAYDRALQIRPEQPKPWFNKACCQAAQGDYEGAIASLSQAIQLGADKYRELARTEPAFEPLRTDDRVVALLALA
ncbi:MAG: tetratricopeptide repeat protein, partial [Cyanobacteria bacterium]|nr:tetratricopeptide repeat protein [Cyanobacteriota bacterium]